jgi:hypothetical protein
VLHMGLSHVFLGPGHLVDDKSRPRETERLSYYKLCGCGSMP